MDVLQERLRMDMTQDPRLKTRRDPQSKTATEWQVLSMGSKLSWQMLRMMPSTTTVKANT